MITLTIRNIWQGLTDVGNRVGIRLDFEERIIEFRRVLHRKDIYREFP